LCDSLDEELECDRPRAPDFCFARKRWSVVRARVGRVEPEARDIIDDRLIRGLHVEAVRRSGLRAEHEPHLIVQSSTLDALFEGHFDGDLSFAELAEHGDFGLGTLDGLDGEMIAVDGRFLRADADGNLGEIPPGARTPFAVVTFFSPVVEFRVGGALEHDELVRELNRRAPPGSPICAVRIDGSFDLVHARSVPRHHPPYPSLTEIAHEQHVFDLRDVEGTIVGFRFPGYAQGLEIAGYHLHFVDAERRRGGHVLACRPRDVTVQIDHAHELHVELPPGIDLGTPHADAADRARIRRIEGEG
jgi:acetolactate decarboxylase